ncbi:hypothetical protein [Paracoccus sp. SY]|nr:hypothetical protein [Paracoccus sp. SY]
MHEYTLILDDQDLAAISAALGKMPIELVVLTFNKIDQQVKD